MAKSRLKKHASSSALHLYILFGLTTFFFGIVAAFMIHNVLAQTADTNQIYACVNKVNGEMRMVTSQDTCRNNENSVKWSIQGPPGPQGPAGSTGGLNQYFGLPFFCTNCYFSTLGDRFAERDFSYAQIVKSIFDGADLHNVKFEKAYLRSNTFNNANLTGSNFSNMQVYSNFGNSKGNSFNNANLTNANFSSSIVQDTEFKGANLSSANFSNATLDNSNFTGATNMSSATFTGATWSNVTCPDGIKLISSTCEGHY